MRPFICFQICLCLLQIHPQHIQKKKERENESYNEADAISSKNYYGNINFSKNKKIKDLWFLL